MNHEPKRNQEHKRKPHREAKPDELLEGINAPSDEVSHVDLHELVKQFNGDKSYGR